MTLFEVFDALELSAVGAAVRDSIWLFPVVESVHLLALALLGGSVLVVDLRLLGLGLAGRSPGYLLAQARPFHLAALAGLIATGIPLFLSEAVKLYFSPPFWVKMGALVAALIFTLGVRDRAIRNGALGPAWRSRAVGLCSLSLWLTVAAAGRWIGFS